MATLVKLRGLDRGAAVGDSPTLKTRGFRVKSGHGLQFPGGVKASATGGTANNAMTVTALYGGTWANGHTFTYAAGGSNHTVAVTVAYAANTGVPTFTYTAGTLATIAEIVTALNANPTFKQLYVASTTGNGTGTSPVSAGALASGTDVGTGQSIYISLAGTTAVVDADDRETVRSLKRNGYRFLSLGAV